MCGGRDHACAQPAERDRAPACVAAPSWHYSVRTVYTMTCVLALLCALGASPFDRGSYLTAVYELGAQRSPLAELAPWHAFVTIPLNSTGEAMTGRTTAPVYLFVSGFGGEEPAQSYSELFSLLASHGIFVVALDRRAKGILINYTEVAASLDGTFEYVTGGGLAADARRRQSSLTPNTSVILLGGHSAGNHVAVRRLLSFGCGNVGGMVWVDPVDGADPYGVIPEFVLHPPSSVAVSTPALHIETGKDPQSVSKDAPACAPRRLSNGRFFTAWRHNPTWQLNATEFGHMDVGNDGVATAALITCPGTHSNVARALYRRTVAGAIAAFAHGLIVDGNMSATAATLDGRVEAPIAPQLLYASQLQGRAPSEIRASCSRIAPGYAIRWHAEV